MQKKGKRVELVYRYLYNFIQLEKTLINQKLPTEQKLCEKLNVSRPTVNKAFNYLVEDNLVYKLRGKGSFVKQKGVIQNNRKLLAFFCPLFDKIELYRLIAEEIINLSETHNFDLLWEREIEPNKYINKLLNFYMSSNIDGIIFIPFQLTLSGYMNNDMTVKKIQKNKIPTVLLDCDYLDFPYRSNFDLVGIDNFKAGYEITSAFLAQGEQRVDFCIYSYSAPTVFQRIRGYQQALVNYGFFPKQEWIHYGNPKEVNFVEKLLKNKSNVFVCSNDMFANDLISTLNKISSSISKEIKVAGFDGINLFQQNIPFMTIEQPFKEIARVTVETLLERIDDYIAPIKSIYLSAKLRYIFPEK